MASKPKWSLRIGVVVHGPEVIDSSSALKALSYLKRFGEVNAVLGGTMGRLAVMDAGLEDVIRISPKRKPSESIKDLQPDSDLIIILNQAKTRETGLAFGRKVAAHAGASRPIIQIDCGGRFVAMLAGSAELEELAKIIAGDLGLEGLKSPDLAYNVSHPAKERSIAEDRIVHNDTVPDIELDRDILKRRITGVLPGELISINGTVVAKATEATVEIWAQNRKIVKIKGAELKPHGLEKLPFIDLENAIVRSGNIRRTEAKPKTRECSGSGAALIYHSAEDAFEIAEDACIAVTVGDDTTAIAGDILSRLGIPLIGIVDGDLDGLSQKTAMPKGSMVIRVETGYDDIIGRRVREEIFLGKNSAFIDASDLADKIMKIARGHIVQVERQ